MLTKITADTLVGQLTCLRKDELSKLLGGRKGLRKQDLVAEAVELIKRLKTIRAEEQAEKEWVTAQQLKMERAEGKYVEAMRAIAKELERALEGYRKEMVRFQTEVTQGFYAIQRELEYADRVMMAACVWKATWHLRQFVQEESQRQSMTYGEAIAHLKDWEEDLERDVIRRDGYLPNSTSVMANIGNMYEFAAKQVTLSLVKQLMGNLKRMVKEGETFAYFDGRLW